MCVRSHRCHLLSPRNGWSCYTKELADKKSRHRVQASTCELTRPWKIELMSSGWLAGWHGGAAAAGSGLGGTAKGRQARKSAAWRSHEVWTNQSSQLSSYVRVRCIPHLDTAAGSGGVQLYRQQQQQ
jgi:hypothetical protein